MTQINEYATEALALGAGDLFDIDKDQGGGNYISEKVSFGTLQTALGGGSNLGNTDLVQSAPQRTFTGGDKNLLWDQLRRYFIELSEWGDDPLAGFLVNQGGLPGNNRTMAEINKNGKVAFRVFENGHVEVSPDFWAVDGQVGGLAVGDGSISLANVSGNQSNAGVLALFASQNNPSVFTDVIFPELPAVFEPQNSAVAWFRSITKGVLMPTMSEIQRDAIVTPEIGLQIFNLDANKMQCYTGIGVSGWSNMN